MKLSEIVTILHAFAPLNRAEGFDNVGLLLGDINSDISGVLVCHDSIEAVVDEAIAEKCNLIVAFHPIIFSGMKSLTGKNYVERAVLKMIKHDISLYAIHTALDNDALGVNFYLAEALGLEKSRFLSPKKNHLLQLTTYVPEDSIDVVTEALFAADAGNISRYSECSFTSKGTGTFKANFGSNPVVGSIGIRESAAEIRLEVLLERGNETKVVSALKAAHPYEEVAYQIYPIENESSNAGLGMIGEFEHPKTEVAFLEHLKSVLNTPFIRHSKLLGKEIKRVAVLGGSGSSEISAAKRAGVDAYVTSDLKYHDFFSAENQLVLVDAGHYETEQFIKSKVAEFLNEKLPNFAIVLSKTNTNPVNYL